MKIIKHNIEKLMEQAGYSYEKVRKEYYISDDWLHTLNSYWLFFDEKENEIRELTGASLECFLFSKYYWAVKYLERNQELEGGPCVDTEQACFFVFEEVMNRLDLDTIDWDMLQAIDEGRYDEEYGEFQ